MSRIPGGHMFVWQPDPVGKAQPWSKPQAAYRIQTGPAFKCAIRTPHQIVVLKKILLA